MKKHIQFLKSTELFNGIEENNIELILKCCDSYTEHYEKQQVIISPESRIEKIGLVLQGHIIVCKDDFWGNRSLIAKIERGRLFAETFAVLNKPNTGLTVVADGPADVMWLNAQRALYKCKNSCSTHDKLILNLLKIFASKNLQINERMTHTDMRSTRQKLLSYLSSKAKINCSAEFDIPLDRQQLADYLAVDRSAMSSELSKLKNEGLIEYNKNHFRLAKAYLRTPQNRSGS